jgi:hypothetical protein
MAVESLRRLATGLVVTCLLVSLGGCARTVSLPAAPHAAAVDCAEVTVRLPHTVAGLSKRVTDAQATAAWGNPADVILRCGVTSPGPTTLHCVNALGVDWVVDDTVDTAIRYTTFGRTPAVQVVLDHTKVSDADVLGDLKAAVTVIPQRRACTGPGDSGTEPTAPATRGRG